MEQTRKMNCVDQEALQMMPAREQFITDMPPADEYRCGHPGRYWFDIPLGIVEAYEMNTEGLCLACWRKEHGV